MNRRQFLPLLLAPVAFASLAFKAAPKPPVVCDTLTLVAGCGITLIQDTVNQTATMIVHGDSTVYADAPHDMLTLVS